MFYLPTRIYFEPGALQKCADALNNLGKRALLVTGKSSAIKSGVLADLKPLLDKLGHSYEVFDQISENPDLDSISAGRDFFLAGGFDYIIGIGGGSPLDAAKAIMLASANKLSKDELYHTEKMQKRYPLALIPTTHGTGSEITQYSVLSDPARKKKAGFGSELAFADIAIIDARYAESLSDTVTLNTTIDSLSHLLEGVYSTAKNRHLFPLIAAGIRMILENLPRVLADAKDLPARTKLMQASLYGGITIAHSSTTLQHSIGYPFTSEFDIPHGLANGMFMRQMMDFYYPMIKEDLLAVFGLAGTTRKSFYLWLEALPLDVKVPISNEMIASKIPEILAARNTLISPRKPSEKELETLLKTVQC